MQSRLAEADAAAKCVSQVRQLYIVRLSDLHGSNIYEHAEK
jgi:hypothetical protein